VKCSVEEDHFLAVIPDVLLMQPEDLRAYIYVEGEDNGSTEYVINIPTIVRPKPTQLYTPEQIDNYSSVM